MFLLVLKVIAVTLLVTFVLTELLFPAITGSRLFPLARFVLYRGRTVESEHRMSRKILQDARMVRESEKDVATAENLLDR